jgi:hypothetical protein
MLVVSFFSLLITSMAHINFYQKSTYASSISSYYSLVSSYSYSEYSLSKSYISMNRALPISLSLTSSSSDDEVSSLVHKILLKTFFVFLLPLYVCFPFE